MSNTMTAKIPLSQIQKIRLYINTEKLSMAAIRAKLGCDYILNGGLYDMSTFKAVCHLKADGTVYAKDPYKYDGYAWDSGGDIRLTRIPNASCANYICCVCLRKDGKPADLYYDSAVAGARPRTVIGMDGENLMLYCTQANKTPEQLRRELVWDSAVMLDGGGSSQCDFRGETLKSSRVVHNLLCIWTKQTEEPDMNERQLREKVLDIAKGWMGKNERDGSFKEIIDLYNAYKPLPVGYKVKDTDEWCAAFASAVFIQAGLTDIAPPECSCERMIQLYKNLGRWKETDSYTPEPGDVIMYDWQDSGSGDSTGWADHVGIVSAVSGKTITVIEGNRNSAVGTREMTVNGRYIRGYCLPDYAGKAAAVQAEEPWYKPAQDWVVQEGISDGSRPGDAATRAEVWQMLCNMKKG